LRSPARELHVALQHDAVLLRLDAHVSRLEVERTGGKRGGGHQVGNQEAKADHRGASIWS